MIHIAKEEDLNRLSRRGFLSLFGTTAATVMAAPTKSFFFFGDILKPRGLPAIPPLPYQEGILFNPPWFSAVYGLVLRPRKALVS